MKYKVLLTGKNKAVKDDFFSQAEKLEPMSTSLRYEDIMTHLKYYQPDAFVYCIHQEVRDDMVKMVTLKHKLEKDKIPFVVVGTEEECGEFDRTAVNVADLILVKPIKASSIEEKIIKHIEELRRAEEEERRQKEEEEAARRAKEEEEEAARRALEEKNRRHHIMIVDDDPTMLKAIKEHLHEDFDVATAISGKVAMKFLENKTTDLILLDYEMPGENGPAVLEKLRENPETKDIPVVFLTGITEREKIAKALVMKPQGYLLKPVDHEKLIETINNILGLEPVDL